MSPGYRTSGKQQDQSIKQGNIPSRNSVSSRRQPAVALNRRRFWMDQSAPEEGPEEGEEEQNFRSNEERHAEAQAL